MTQPIDPFLLKPDSALRRLPVKVARDQALFFDGIRFCAQMAALSYERLLGDLARLSRPKEQDSAPLNERVLTAAVSDAWTIVDVVNRLRSLTAQMPGLKKKSPGVQLFLQRTDAVEPLRNFVQHINNEIKPLAKTGVPLLGFLQWVATMGDSHHARGFLLYAGTVTTFTQDVEFSKVESPDGTVGQVRLVAAETTLVLKSIVNEAVNLATFCESVLEPEAQDGLRRSADLLVGIDLGFALPG